MKERMNIQTAPGLSCSVYQVLSFGPFVARRRLREFWKSYLQSGDIGYDYQKFAWLTVNGQLLHFEVQGFSGLLCRYGLEISVDEHGPYVAVPYLAGVELTHYLA